MNRVPHQNTRQNIVWLVGLAAFAALTLGIYACNLPTGTPASGQPTATEAATATIPPTTSPPTPTDTVSSDEPPTQVVTPTPIGYTDYSAFQGVLLDAIVKREYDKLKSLMGDTFVIAMWQSEGRELSPDQAINELRTNYLPPTGYVYYELGEDLTTLLGGIDPLTMWGPDVNAVSAIRFTGWGVDGNTEAIIIIAQRPNGTYYWHAVLLGSFTPTAPA